MVSVFLIIGAFLLAVLFSELALKGTKLQTGLVTVVLVHGLVAGLLFVYLLITEPALCPGVIIFWAGAFLSWFGVQSHIQSSILLRMIYILRGGSLQEGKLLQDYESHYGASQRMQELFQGGLLEKTPAGIVVREKGRFILRIVSYLT